jgi:hypothetical protein
VTRSVPPDEIELVQNPALGSVLLWVFARAYQAEKAEEVPVHLSFLVLPLVLHSGSLAGIVSTRKASGLTVFAAKLGEQRENLLAVHDRAHALRALTLQSIGLGTQSGLLTVDYQAATLRGNTLDGGEPPHSPERMRNMRPAAEKLGCWLAKMDIQQIASILRVEF